MAQDTPKTDRFTQIQEIIFGEHAEAWEKRFSELENRLAAFEEQTGKHFAQTSDERKQSNSEVQASISKLQDRVTQNEAVAEQQVEALKAAFESALGQLRAEKMDKSALGEFLIQWGKEVNSQ